MPSTMPLPPSSSLLSASAHCGPSPRVLLIPVSPSTFCSPSYPCTSSSSRFAPRNKPPHRAFVCEIAVELDGVSSSEGIAPTVGSKIRVLGPLKVFHVPKNPKLDIGGCEGVIKDVLKSWKGKPISANLPYKVQFELELQGKQVKFVAHLKEGEFEVIG